ncbi:MAG: RNA polymerase sigma factor [Aureliella sp.]
MILRIRNDDSCAWRELVELYTPLIAFWCRQKGLPRDAIHDCIQDVFYAVLRSLGDFRPSGVTGCFRAWLWTITRNKIVDSIRKDMRNQTAGLGNAPAADVLLIPDAMEADEPTDGPRFSQLLHRALAQVRAEFEPKTWQAFWRATIDAAPASQVAEELDISPAAVRKYRSRVLRRLREQLGDDA